VAPWETLTPVLTKTPVHGVPPKSPARQLPSDIPNISYD